MLCSVIIPLYNKQDYVAGAISSVLSQSWGAVEVIVVDDGSVDNSALVARSIGDPRVRVISQSNGGVSAARNRGISEARGELILFLDADDWYLENFLETMVGLANRYPEKQFFACGFKRVASEQADLLKESGDRHAVELVDNFFARWRRGAFFCTNSVAIRRSSLDHIHPWFPPGESLGEDQDLWYRLVEQFGIIFCPAILVAYRIDVEGSLCAVGRLLEIPPNYTRLEKRVRSGNFNPSLRYEALQLVVDMRLTVARTLLVNSNRRCAFVELYRAKAGVLTKRWWITFAMILVATPSLVMRWELWRSKKIPQ